MLSRIKIDFLSYNNALLFITFINDCEYLFKSSLINSFFVDQFYCFANLLTLFYFWIILKFTYYQ